MSDNRQSKRPRRKGFFSGANTSSSTSMTTRAMAKSTNLSNLTKMTRPTKPTRRSPRKGSPQWPANALPVEIFECIASYLPRSTILNMRLVNKEFEASVAACLFQVVVVGFNPQLYGVAEPKVTNYVLQNSIMLQDKGMRVFQGFGKWIKRFGMSFEIDMQKLTSPPTKVDQVTVPAFWGYYQWPHTDYHRYPNLEGLEQTADETGSMAKAMHFVSTANELALSIDAGLGWLAGPDINQRVAARGEKLTVFSASRFVKEPARQPSRSVPGNRGLSSPLTTSLEDDLQDAGYDLDSLDPELRTMLQNHALDDALDDAQYQQNVQVLDNNNNNNNNNNNASGGSVNLGQASMPRLRSQQLSLLLGLDDGADNNAEYAVPRRILRNALMDLTKDVYVKTICPLKPNDLTAAQREMLLEMEWAQMAFTQSWAIAVMDNHKTFNNILTLNLARVPHRHLAILCREDFWDSLPSVETLQLGVIPDWREVKKEGTSYVQDTRLAPSQSILGVYKLLSTHIAHRNNIKSLHFEWLGGGEYAPGLFARNRHVMAAPVVPNARDMVNRELPGVEQCAILHLPHIEDLSFKNCYFTPHVLERLLSRLRKCALKTIGFDSVSLTANVPQGSHPNPTSQAAQNANALQAFQWNAAAAMHMAVVGGGGPQMGVNAMAAPGLPHPGAGAVGNPANWFFQQGILYPPGRPILFNASTFVDLGLRCINQ